MRRDGNRPRRIAELVKRELAAMIPRELDDPRAHHVTLTYAEVSPDLAHARVYFTLLAGSREAPTVAKALNRASGLLRRTLAERLRLRVVPDLRFEFDSSVERGDRLTQLIDRAVSQDRKGHEE